MRKKALWASDSIRSPEHLDEDRFINKDVFYQALVRKHKMKKMSGNLDGIDNWDHNFKIIKSDIFVPANLMPRMAPLAPKSQISIPLARPFQSGKSPRRLELSQVGG